MRPKLLDLHLSLLAGLALAALAPLAALRQLPQAHGASALASLIAALAAPAPLVGALALLAPGYALTAALFPQCTLGGARRLMYSLGLSLSILALGGLLLNFTPGGLSYDSWALLLGAVTLAASVVALWRGDGRALPLVALIRMAHRRRQAGWAPDGRALRTGALLGVACALIWASLAISVAGAQHAQQNEQTATGASLWALSVGRPSAPELRLGVRNLSGSETHYRLTLTMAAETLQVWPTLKLKANATWMTTVNIVALAARAHITGAAGALRVTTTLALTSAPNTAYRQALTWVKLPATARRVTTPTVGKRRIPPSIRPAL